MDAVRTMLRRAWPLKPTMRDARVLWIRALRETYAAELRPEGADRAVKIFEADQARYERLTPLVLDELGRPEVSPEKAAA